MAFKSKYIEHTSIQLYDLRGLYNMQGRTFNYLVLQHHGLGHTTKDSVLIIMPSYTTLDRLERL